MNKELATTIGRAAREARTALQLTQEDAAERIHVSVEFYARIERGKSLPSIGTFARIVSALGVSADSLLGARPPIATVAAGMTALWSAPAESPEMRRLTRRLRKARPSTLRLVGLMVKEFEGVIGESLGGELAAADDGLDEASAEMEHRAPPLAAGRRAARTASQAVEDRVAEPDEDGDRREGDARGDTIASTFSGEPRAYAEGSIAAG